MHWGLLAHIWSSPGGKSSQSVPASPRGYGSGFPCAVPAEEASVSSANTRNHGNRQALARGSMRGGRGRMRNRQDAHLTRQRFHPCRWTAVHCLAMVPPQLVEKWARECFLTLPGVRVFIIDGCETVLARMVLLASMRFGFATVASFVKV